MLNSYVGTTDMVYQWAIYVKVSSSSGMQKSADLVCVEGGAQLLSASHLKEVDQAVIHFVGKWSH